MWEDFKENIIPSLCSSALYTIQSQRVCVSQVSAGKDVPAAISLPQVDRQVVYGEDRI
jgi:hypothetical protein